MPRRTTTKRKPDAVEAERAVEGMFETPRPGVGNALAMPELKPGLGAVVERVFDLDDPAAEFEAILAALTIEDAVTPDRIVEALNHAEDTARRAHRLFVVTKADNGRYEVECDAVMSALRDAATAELQREKDEGKRSKAITEADVSSRVAAMYPDEWNEINSRRARAKGMLDHVKRVADLWESRCFSLGAMAGRKRRSSF